ncbi:hypothetical protein BH23ACT10_BH23ACT10_35370 [soil metagenome]
MRSRRVALWLLVTGEVVVGAWAQFAPASFYTSFPAGRAWVAADGPYNEHLIRDVGGLSLALALLLAIAAIRLRPDVVRIAAAAALVYSVPHFVYHLLHLELYGVVDATANIAALGGAVALPLWLLVWPEPRRRKAPRAVPTVVEVSTDDRR